MRRVRRRNLGNLLLEAASGGAAAAMAALILLIVVGTQIMDWYWPVVLLGAGSAVAAWRAARRWPNAYQVAQRVDRRLGLHDAVSTAYFFSHADGRRECVEVRQAQRRRAEALASEIQPRLAAPFAVPGGLRRTAGLALAAVALIGVRYGVRRSLDLRPPLADAIFDVFRFPARYVAGAEKPDRTGKDDRSKQAAMALDPETARPGQNRTPAREISESPDSQGPAQQADARNLPPSEPIEGDEPAEGASAGDGSSDGDRPPSADSATDAAANQERNPDARPPGENSSLLDKMKDAFANLLAKLKIQPKFSPGRQMASTGQEGRPSGQSRQEAGERGSSEARNRSGAEGRTSPDAQGDQMGDSAERAPGGKSDKGANDETPQEGRSGIGKQDGAKDLREAEQLAAMGKISEILGKRAQNITGEVMIEVASGDQQQLKTPYTDRRASHAEAGGEIHRDEIPLVYQQYIQQYFEEVRKAPPAAATKGPARR